jgi:undecaprenyl-diphosphatase
MLASEFIGRRSRRMETITVRDSVFMGAAQGLAVLPGFSRSGSTIATGLASGLTREASARFSFLMAVPAIAGAAALVLIDLSRRPDAVHPGAVALLIGAGVSFLTGLLALGLLMRVLRRGSLRPFVVYCIVAGAAIVIARLAGV